MGHIGRQTMTKVLKNSVFLKLTLQPGTAKTSDLQVGNAFSKPEKPAAKLLTKDGPRCSKFLYESFNITFIS